MVNTAILKKSMSEAGCIAPFMPRNISKDYPICESFETGTLAWDIYNKYVYEAQFSPDSEVGTLTGSPFSLQLFVQLQKPCSVMMATLVKKSVAGKTYPYNLTTKPTTVSIELPTSVEVLLMDRLGSPHFSELNHYIEGQ